jgi:hypothetical protein
MKQALGLKANAHSPTPRLGSGVGAICGHIQWLRRRVRMYYWKQWKRARNRRRQLIRLGNLGDDADSTGALCGQFAGAIYI